MCNQNQNQVNYDRDPDKNREKASSETAFTVHVKINFYETSCHQSSTFP